MGDHVSRHSHTRPSQSLQLATANGRRWWIWTASQKQEPTGARDRRTRWIVARRPWRRDLRTAWAKRRGQVDDGRHSYHTRATNGWAGMDRRLRCVGATSRREAINRRRRATSESRLRAHGARDPAFSWRVLRRRFAHASRTRHTATRSFQTKRSRRSARAWLLRRDDATPVDRARHDAQSAG